MADEATAEQISQAAAAVAAAIERFLAPYEQLPEAARVLRSIGSMAQALRESQTRIDAAWAEAQRQEKTLKEGGVRLQQEYAATIRALEEQIESSQRQLEESRTRLGGVTDALALAERQLEETEARTAATVEAAEARVATAQTKLRQLLGEQP